VRGAFGNGVIQRRAMAAEHSDGRAGARQRGRDLAADAPSPAGDERMRGMRQSGHALISPNEFIKSRPAYILDFKLLQEISASSARLGQACLTDRVLQVASR
jgi:hypothetical protein